MQTASRQRSKSATTVLAHNPDSKEVMRNEKWDLSSVVTPTAGSYAYRWLVSLLAHRR